jgi:hypothetical protein
MLVPWIENFNMKANNVIKTIKSNIRKDTYLEWEL